MTKGYKDVLEYKSKYQKYIERVNGKLNIVINSYRSNSLIIEKARLDVKI